MVCLNFLNFWLTALLLFGAVLPLVHGDYATCPTTKGETLGLKKELLNPASYHQRKCKENYPMCCAEKKHWRASVTLHIKCAAGCYSVLNLVDCSIAENRCRNLADVIEYYKSSAFKTCPFYHRAVSTGADVHLRSFVNHDDTFCPATDTCSVAKLGSTSVKKGVSLEIMFTCFTACEMWQAEWMKGIEGEIRRVVLPCTPCSSNDDCKLKLDRVISHPNCPTTKVGLNMANYFKMYKETIENPDNYEEKPCFGTDKCCAYKRMFMSLEIHAIKCMSSCVSPMVDCGDYTNNCRDLDDIRSHGDYKYCIHFASTNTINFNDRRPDYRDEKFLLVLCPYKSSCAAGRYELHREYEVDGAWIMSMGYAGCMKGCEEHFYPWTKICKACSTHDECREILEDVEPPNLTPP